MILTTQFLQNSIFEMRIKLNALNCVSRNDEFWKWSNACRNIANKRNSEPEFVEIIDETKTKLRYTVYVHSLGRSSFSVGTIKEKNKKKC